MKNKGNPHLDQELFSAIKRYLMAFGQASSAQVCQALAISQPTFSRAIKQIKEELLISGKASKTQYAFKRSIQDVDSPIPIHLISDQGKAKLIANLHPIHPRGFYLEALDGNFESRFYSDLPYFLEDMQASGFLGRLVPQKYRELDLPSDILKWSTDQSLKYLSHHGSDLTGNLILGKKSFTQWLRLSESQTNHIATNKRTRQYPDTAAHVLEFGQPGSSAGGEQPKFLALLTPEQAHVMVKFSPPKIDRIANRISDLLVCEHVAHDVLHDCEQPASDSEVHVFQNQTFLTVKRFDRKNKSGRAGVLSLKALDLEHVGKMGSWTKTAESLFRQKKIKEDALNQIAWLEFFGHLIANSDMHLGNLSFFSNGEHILKLTPVYDMLPMLYAPTQNQILVRKFTPLLPDHNHAQVWLSAWRAAKMFWKKVSTHKLISADFKKIAKQNLVILEKLGYLEKKF